MLQNDGKGLHSNAALTPHGIVRDKTFMGVSKPKLLWFTLWVASITHAIP